MVDTKEAKHTEQGMRKPSLCSRQNLGPMPFDCKRVHGVLIVLGTSFERLRHRSASCRSSASLARPKFSALAVQKQENSCPFQIDVLALLK